MIDATIDARTLTRTLSRYRDASTTRGIVELLVTAMPLLVLWLVMWGALWLGHASWLYALLIVPTAGFLLRLFMIQHDCGHGAFFRSRRTNDYVGRVIGVLTLTPYDYWRRTHAAHHAGAGNLDRPGYGGVVTLTVGEYQARSEWSRFRYRLFRHPLVMFGLGPFLSFLRAEPCSGRIATGRWRAVDQHNGHKMPGSRLWLPPQSG